MTLVRSSPDSVVLEFTTEELSLVLTALGSILGYLEPIGAGELDPYLHSGLSKIYLEAVEALRASGAAAERDGPPFTVGEDVSVASPFGPLPDIPDGTAATIVSVNPEDDTRDYAWCLVRLKDGREVALAQHDLRRTR